MARENSFHFGRESPCVSRTRLFAFLSFLFLASPCDAQIKSMSDGSLGGDLFFRESLTNANQSYGSSTYGAAVKAVFGKRISVHLFEPVPPNRLNRALKSDSIT